MAYGLTDGAGIQAFALVVSETPLPSFNEWRAGRGACPWRSTLDEPLDKIRVFSNGLERIYQPHRLYRRNVRGIRGAGETLQGKSVLADLIDWLREDKQFVAVEVWGLPIRPRVSRLNGLPSP